MKNCRRIDAGDVTRASRTVCFSKRILNLRLWSTKEGVGETSGQTVGSSFSTGFALRKPVRRKKEVFFIGADPKVRNFTGALRRLGFGPDVFADALVPRRRVTAARAVISQILKVDLTSCGLPGAAQRVAEPGSSQTRHFLRFRLCGAA